jgi:hypothetical protein
MAFKEEIGYFSYNRHSRRKPLRIKVKDMSYENLLFKIYKDSLY